MAIEHASISDAKRHETKGASTATNGQVHKANGDGTTTWVTPSTLNNITVGSSLEGVSNTSQNPVGVDTPLQVTWGSGTSNADCDIASNGVVTILTAGLYFITIVLNIGRTNNTTIANVLARALINDVAINPVISRKIDGDTSVTSVTIPIFRSFIANDTIKVQILRDSAGQNDGGLITIDPVLAGWSNSPAAYVKVQKITGGF